MAIIVFWLLLSGWVSWFILSLGKKQSQLKKWCSYSCLWWLRSIGCHRSWLVTMIHTFFHNFGKCCLGHVVWSIMLPPHTILKWMAKWNGYIKVWSKSCAVLSPPYHNKTGIWFCQLPSFLWTALVLFNLTYWLMLRSESLILCLECPCSISVESHLVSHFW